MIRAAVSTPYIRACLNTTRQTTKRFAMSNNAVRTFVAEATIPKVILHDNEFFPTWIDSILFSSRIPLFSVMLLMSTVNGLLLTRLSLFMVCLSKRE